jgi:hypothetical protein
MAKVNRTAHRGARNASISKRKASQRKPSGRMRVAPAVHAPGDLVVEDQLISSDLSLHELFQQQTRQILDRTDLEEDQKQHILVAMSCPCCGAGAMSFTAKLRR